MDILIPKFIQYQLYLLQLENYELGRYFKLLWKKGFWPKKNQQQRKELVWTAKARALLTMAFGCHAIFMVIAGLAVMHFKPGFDNLILALAVVFFVLLPVYFLLFSLALILIWPLDAYVKKGLVKKAQLKIERLKDLKIIGIAGSYGKTTMKEVLKEVLSIKYKVQSPGESVNTPVGIARFILNKVSVETQILILELGEHYKGDIKEICEIGKLDIAVVTGINEAHMERMGSLDNISATIFEAVECAKDNALVVLNGDDKNVVENYRKFLKQKQVVEQYQISNFQFPIFDSEKLGWEGKINDMDVEIGLLGEYALGDAAAAVIVAKKLGLTPDEIRMGLLAVRPVEHRLQPIKSSGDVLIIDDAYNGNPDGAAEAIKVLSRFTNRRKIYITPGLVETGSAAPEVHRAIGKQLAEVANVVILIKNSVTSDIELGIMNYELGERPRPQVVWFDSAIEAHEGLKNIIKPGDVVLFQNDWGDQYL